MRSVFHHDTVNMTEGPILKKLVIYAVPIVLSGFLQLLFNAADIAVVGRFTGSDALAAVSAAGPVSSLIVTLFMGLSVGANVVAAQDAGAGRDEELSRAVHTSVALALLLGLALMGAGLLCADALLTATQTPESVLPQAHTYLFIYFLGVPASMVYNFGAAILRAVGDTRRPMLFLLAAGVLNFLLNLLFVAGFGMGVAGVAIATALSETVSGILILLALLRARGAIRLDLRRLRLHRDKLAQLLKIGVPAGIQGSAFSISNLLIQSSINSLGPAVMAASAVAWTIDSFCYVGVSALGQAATSFTGQNYGAGNFGRIRKIYRITFWLSFGILAALGALAYLFARPLLGLFTTDPAVVEVGVEIMLLVCVFGFVNGAMDIPFNVARGMGRSVFPMASSLLCVCALRVVWVFTVFAWSPTVTALFLSYPVTKSLCAVTGILYYHWIMRQWQYKSADGEG